VNARDEVTYQNATPAVFGPLWETGARDARYLGAWGGRGSGKSWDRALWFVTRMATEDDYRLACVREVQKSLKDSVHQLLVDTIKREGLESQFEITERAIRNILTGGYAIFMGMRDQSAEAVKSLESMDAAWVEEAQNMSQRSLEVLRPTIRKPRSQIHFTWNPRFKHDPVDQLLRQSEATAAERIIVKANWDTNPHFTDELERERQIDLIQSPERYAHIWEGAYETESDTQFITGAVVAAARTRPFYVDTSDPCIIGVDVARYGDDRTVIKARRGNDARSMPAITLKGSDTMQTVGRVMELANEVAADAIFVDETGVGSGVVDRLHQLTDIAIGINFGARSDHYVQGLAKAANKRAEIWGKMREHLRKSLALEDSDDWEQDLTGPLYSFDVNNAILLEKKDAMRSRGVRSPDLGDALALTYAYPVIARALQRREQERQDENYDPVWSSM
jgi:hypothetical protein